MTRTTLMLDKMLLRDLKRIAADERRTLTDVTREVLRRGLDTRRRPKRRRIKPLPSFSCGRPLVDINDRNKLYDVLDGR